MAYNDGTAEEYMPLREVVFVTLRRQILTGELKPGERLMEIALAQRLGVSRTPIREAIRKLENEGLVVIAPRRGAHVAKITTQELNDVLEVRKTLEILAIRKACKQIREIELADLKRREKEFADLIESGSSDINALGDADAAFHDVIYLATRNRRLIQILNNLHEQMYRFRIEYLKEEDARKRLVAEHEEIMQALKSRDEEACVRLIGEHIDNQWQTINASLVREEESGK